MNALPPNQTMFTTMQNPTYWSKSVTCKFYHSKRNTFLKVEINM